MRRDETSLVHTCEIRTSTSIRNLNNKGINTQSGMSGSLCHCKLLSMSLNFLRKRYTDYYHYYYYYYYYYY